MAGTMAMAAKTISSAAVRDSALVRVQPAFGSVGNNSGRQIGTPPIRTGRSYWARSVSGLEVPDNRIAGSVPSGQLRLSRKSCLLEFSGRHRTQHAAAFPRFAVTNRT